MLAESPSVVADPFAEVAGFYHQIIESVQDGVAVMALDGTQLAVNSALCLLTGFSREELVGKTAPYPYWPPEELHVAAGVQERMSRGEFAEFEFRCMKKDGRRFPTLINPSPVRNADGQIVCFVATVKDISERRALEARAREMEKLDAIAELAGGIAHEFNNLLTTILGLSSLLGRRAPPELRSELAEIEAAGRRAGGLTRSLLTFSRRQLLSPRVLDLGEELARNLGHLRELAGPRVSVELAPGPAAHVRADPAQLVQMIANLVANGRDAMPDGGVVSLRTELADDPAGEVCISVSDQGSGVDESIRARIFEPFFSTRDRREHVGLGLAIAYGIARQSGGRLALDDRSQGGATFRAWLPLAEPAMPAPPPEAMPPGGAAPTVLVVDDEPVLRRIIGRILASEGYVVLDAPDGAAALDVAAAHRGAIDLLLTDVIMPKMNGRALAERLRNTYPSIRVVFMSGYADRELGLDEVSERDPLAFLPKPFFPDDLLDRVRKALAEPRPSSASR